MRQLATTDASRSDISMRRTSSRISVSASASGARSCTLSTPIAAVLRGYGSASFRPRRMASICGERMGRDGQFPDLGLSECQIPRLGLTRALGLRRRVRASTPGSARTRYSTRSGTRMDAMDLRASPRMTGSSSRQSFCSVFTVSSARSALA